MTRKESGFSIAELIIVVGMIGILSGTFLFVYPKYLSKSRDTVRRHDLRVYQVAFENYANRNAGYYPAFTSSTDIDLMCGASVLNEPSCTDDPLSTFSSLPGWAQFLRQIGLFDWLNNIFHWFNVGPNYKYISNGGSSGSATATVWLIYATLEEKFNGQTYLWVACSDGRTGRVLPSTSFANGVCPANLLQ
ncbi:MAG: type II secretion system protein [Candidatus Woesebacteria bacterium]|nr:MAG: type II secretion system protein [Candidatus Woesebacteria bacterium]